MTFASYRQRPELCQLAATTTTPSANVATTSGHQLNALVGMTSAPQVTQPRAPLAREHPKSVMSPASDMRDVRIQNS